MIWVTNIKLRGSGNYNFNENTPGYDKIKLLLQENGDFLSSLGIEEVNEELLEIAIKNKKKSSSYLSEEMKYDKLIGFMSVMIDPSSICFFHQRIRDDIHTVVNAVSQDGLLLKYASPRLKNNSLIISRAYFQNPKSIIHASDEFQNLQLLIKFHFNQNFNWKYREIKFKFI
jgi:hypothetical protein